MELAVVGNEEFVLGFKLVGIRKTYSIESTELEGKINEVLEDRNVGILVLHTDDVQKLSSAMKRRLTSLARPVVIAVGKKEEEDLRTKVKRAIGIDLYRTA